MSIVFTQLKPGLKFVDRGYDDAMYDDAMYDEVMNRPSYNPFVERLFN